MDPQENTDSSVGMASTRLLQLNTTGQQFLCCTPRGQQEFKGKEAQGNKQKTMWIQALKHKTERCSRCEWEAERYVISHECLPAIDK